MTLKGASGKALEEEERAQRHTRAKPPDVE
jgi:hypothetical protein